MPSIAVRESNTISNIAGGTSAIAVAGSYSYVLNFTGLRVLDNSNPANPVAVGSLDIAYAQKIAIAGNYAYITTSNGLSIIDISTPSNLVGVSNFSLPSTNNLAVTGNYAYLTTFNNELSIIDISTPSNPISTGSAPLPFSSFGYSSVAIAGNYAYVYGGSYGSSLSLNIFDISVPSSPVSTASLDLAGTFYSYSSDNPLAIAGNYAYLGVGNQFRIVDITTPSAPSPVSTFTTPFNIKDISIAGSTAYVTTTGGLSVLDITNPTSPATTGSVSINGARDAAIFGDYAYVIDAGVLHIIGNTAPIAQDGTVVAVENLNRVFSSSDFPFADIDPADQGNAKQIKITALPSTGVFYLDQNSNGVNESEDVQVGQIISGGNLGKLKFKPDNTIGTSYTSLKFKVNDGFADSNEATLNLVIIDVDPVQVNINGLTVPLNTALDSLTGQVGMLSTQNQQLDGQVTSLTGQMTSLTGQVGTLSTENQQLNGQVTSLTGQVGTLSTRNQQLDGQSNQFSGQINALITQNQQLTGRITQFSEQLKALSNSTPTALVVNPLLADPTLLNISFGDISWDEPMIGTQKNDRLKGSNKDEQINGKGGNDRIFGLGGINFVYGGDGNDRLNGGEDSNRLDGGAGNDSLLGGSDRDLLLGGSGQDTLLGGAGNDILMGGQGADLLVGGEGQDVFRYRKVNEGGDTIRDFDVSEDVIDLRAVFEKVASKGVSSGDRFRQFVKLVESSNGVQVQVNANGINGSANFVTLATLQNTSLSAIKDANLVTY